MVELNTLPNEILEHIIIGLPSYADRKRLASTSKSFNSLVDEVHHRMFHEINTGILTFLQPQQSSYTSISTLLYDKLAVTNSDALTSIIAKFAYKYGMFSSFFLDATDVFTFLNDYTRITGSPYLMLLAYELIIIFILWQCICQSL